MQFRGWLIFINQTPTLHGVQWRREIILKIHSDFSSKIQSNVRYLNVRLHYRLSYGGSYKFSQISLKISSKIQSNVRYLNVRSHYRLSYGGLYN